MNSEYRLNPDEEDDFDYEDEHVELESDIKEYGEDDLDEGSSEEDEGLTTARRDLPVSEAALFARAQEQKLEHEAEIRPTGGESAEPIAQEKPSAAEEPFTTEKTSRVKAKPPERKRRRSDSAGNVKKAAGKRTKTEQKSGRTRKADTVRSATSVSKKAVTSKKAAKNTQAKKKQPLKKTAAKKTASKKTAPQKTAGKAAAKKKRR